MLVCFIASFPVLLVVIRRLLVSSSIGQVQIQSIRNISAEVTVAFVQFQKGLLDTKVNFLLDEPLKASKMK